MVCWNAETVATLESRGSVSHDTSNIWVRVWKIKIFFLSRYSAGYEDHVTIHVNSYEFKDNVLLIRNRALLPPTHLLLIHSSFTYPVFTVVTK
jgi:hypothetical protein